jgi:hypothetical protein
MGIKLMTLMRFTRPGLRLLSHLGRTLLLDVATPLGERPQVFWDKWLRLSSSSGLMHGWSTWLIL